MEKYPSGKSNIISKEYSLNQVTFAFHKYDSLVPVAPLKPNSLNKNSNIN